MYVWYSYLKKIKLTKKIWKHKNVNIEISSYKFK